MPSKIKPIPLRLGDERQTRVDAYAARFGKSRHAAVLALVDQALDEGEARVPEAGIPTAATPTPKARKAKAKPGGNRMIPVAEIRAGSPLDTSMVPELGTFERKPMQKAKNAPRAKWKV